MRNELGLNIWYDDPERVSISGKGEALQNLVQRIDRGEDTRCTLAPDPDISTGGRNRDYLQHLEVKIATGLATISIQEDTIVFSGAYENLRFISRCICNVYDSLTLFDNKHTHIEYVPGLGFMAPDSLALVVYLRI